MLFLIALLFVIAVGIYLNRDSFTSQEPEQPTGDDGDDWYDPKDRR